MTDEQARITELFVAISEAPTAAQRKNAAAQLARIATEVLETEQRSYVVRDKCPQCGRAMFVDNDAPRFVASECEVCGARPDSDGWIYHGRGCYQVSEDGGGIEAAEELPRRVCKTCRARLNEEMGE